MTLTDQSFLVSLSPEDISALDACLQEYGFSTEPGGANEDDAQAQLNYELVSRLLMRVASGSFLVVCSEKAYGPFESLAKAEEEAQKMALDGPWKVISLKK